VVDNMVKIKPHESLYSCFTPSGSGYIVHMLICAQTFVLFLELIFCVMLLFSCDSRNIFANCLY